MSVVKARSRDFYAPNSEDLGPNEMRLIACGTGMPTARPKQAASCWLLELGNGDKFLFDVGTGSNERISATQIPYNSPPVGHELGGPAKGETAVSDCSGAVGDEAGPLDADLVSVNAAWPHLPEDVRTKVMALVTGHGRADA